MVHHLCAHHTPFPSTFCQFSNTQALPRMFRIWSHRRIWTQLPTLSPTSWSDPTSTLALEALLLGGWHTHWRPTTTPQLPPAMFHSCTCTHLHLWPDHTAFGPACLLRFNRNTTIITRSGFRRNLRVSQIVGLGHFLVDLHSAYNLMYINKPLI